MTQQFSLEFERHLSVPAQIGMAKADENASERWKHIFDACVLAAARKKPEITSDDVLTEIQALPNAPSTHSLDAIGPAMVRASKMGIIRATDRMVRSKIATKHSNNHRVWLSLYFTGGTECR